MDPNAFFYLADAAERWRTTRLARQALLDYRTSRRGRRRPSRLTMEVRQGELSVKLKELSAAVGYFRHAAAEPAADASVLVRLADAQWRAGELDAARGTLQRALERAPTDPQALVLKRRFGSPSYEGESQRRRPEGTDFRNEATKPTERTEG